MVKWKIKKATVKFSIIFLALALAIGGLLMLKPVESPEQPESNVKIETVDTGYFDYEYGYDSENQIMTNWDSLSFQVNQNGLITVKKNQGLISRFGFAIQGKINNVPYTYTSEDFTWNWIHDIIGEEHVFTAYNNQANFNWTQVYHFYPDKPLKISHIITNNLGQEITEAKMWYVHSIKDKERVEWNGTEYEVNMREIGDRHWEGNFNTIIPKITLLDHYYFNYSDILSDSFDITNVYIGNGSVVNHPEKLIMAIGFTKSSITIPDGYTVYVDPTLEAVETTDQVGKWNSILVDGDGVVHIVFESATGTAFRYCNNTGGSWSCAQIDNTQYRNYPSATKNLDMDSNGVLWTSFNLDDDAVESTGDSKYYCNNTGGTWGCAIVENVDTKIYYAGNIQIGSDDNVWTIWGRFYVDTSEMRVGNSSDGGASWTIAQPETTDAGTDVSLCLDSNDVPHVKHHEWDGVDGYDWLRYCNKTSGSWTCERADTTYRHDTGVLILDSNDNPHIVTHDLGNADLIYCNKSSGSWGCAQVETTGTIGETPSIAVDAADNLHICHFDDSNNIIRYCNSTDHVAWNCENVGTTGGDLGYCDITAIASDGTALGDVHISYYNDSADDLYYAKLTGYADSGNTAPTVVSRTIKPSSPVYGEDDITINVTCNDTNTGDTITAYWDIFKNNTREAFWNGSMTVTNATNTTLAVIPNANFSAGNTVIAEIWCGDGTENTTKANTSTATYQNTSSPVYLYIRNATAEYQSNVTVTYGTTVNFTGVCEHGTCGIFKDGVSTGYNNTSVVWGVGTYNITVNSTGDANHNLNETNYYIIVNRATPTLTGTVTATLTYESASDYSGSESNSGDYDCVYVLARNGTVIASGSSVSDTTVLGNGTYNYTYNNSECTNYTAGSDTDYLVVFRKDANIQVLPATATETYPYSALQYFTNSSQRLLPKIYRNNVEITNGTLIVLGVGTYNYVANLSDTVNYTNHNDSETLTISQNTSTSTYMNLTLNGTEVNRTYIYPNGINATGWYDTSVFSDQVITFTLYSNNVSNGTTNPVNEIILFGNGSYNYTYHTIGNTNYSTATKTFWLFVTKGPTSTALYLNKSEANKYYKDNAKANFTAVVNVSGLTVNLGGNYTHAFYPSSGTTSLINETTLTNTSNQVFNITGYFTENANYTSSSTTRYAYLDVTSPTAYSFSLNDSYANFNQSVQIIVNTTDSFGISKVIAEVQTSGSTTNYTLTLNAAGNYTYNLTKTELGETSSNATTINITKIYINDTSNNNATNSSNLNFSYGLMSLSVSNNPTSTITPGTNMNIYADYNTTEGTDIVLNCTFIIGANSYDMSYDSTDERHEKAVNTSSFSNQVYTYSITCSNSSYQTKTGSGTFSVQAGSPGGPTGGGGGGGGVREILAVGLGESCDEETPCASGLTCEDNFCIQPEVKFCGNGVCDPGESFIDCPKDCPTQEPPVAAQGMFLIIAGSIGYAVFVSPRIDKGRRERRKKKVRE